MGNQKKETSLQKEMAEKTQMKRRPVFSDGGNSFSHVVFGMASAYIQVGVLVFVAYQMHDFRNANFVVDMLEFAIGYALMCALRSLIARHSQLTR